MSEISTHSTPSQHRQRLLYSVVIKQDGLHVGLLSTAPTPFASYEDRSSCGKDAMQLVRCGVSFRSRTTWKGSSYKNVGELACTQDTNQWRACLWFWNMVVILGAYCPNHSCTSPIAIHYKPLSSYPDERPLSEYKAYSYFSTNGRWGVNVSMMSVMHAGMDRSWGIIINFKWWPATCHPLPISLSEIMVG